MPYGACVNSVNFEYCDSRRVNVVMARTHARTHACACMRAQRTQTHARKRPHNLMTGTLANRGLNNPISLKERRTLDHALHEAAESDKEGPSSSTTTVD